MLFETQIMWPRLMILFMLPTPPGEKIPLTKWDASQIWPADRDLTLDKNKNTLYFENILNSLNSVI